MWETYKFWSIGYKFRGDGSWEIGDWSEKGKGKSRQWGVLKVFATD